MTLRLTKHHGLGNDFLVALAAANAELTPDAKVAIALCDRHRGVGADGLLWGLPPSEPGADLRMVLHNADGSEAEISGNGIRCLAQAHASAVGLERGQIVIDTAAGRRTLELEPGDEPHQVDVTVDMGRASPGPSLPAEAAALIGRHATFSIGNPHLVVEVESVDEVDIARVGPELEKLVPGGLNVHALEPLGDDAIRLLHWERGAGVTEACGSGASVAALAARDWGLVGDQVRVEMPGGVAEVHVAETIRLRGPAVFVAEVVVP